jgi:hypothetical protein
MAEVCWYADEEYSEGSIIKAEGETYECGDLGDGKLRWIPSFGGKGRAKAVRRNEAAAPLTAAAVCIYEGKKYSPGAPKKMGDGKIHYCGTDGKWHPKPPPST